MRTTGMADARPSGLGTVILVCAVLLIGVVLLITLLPMANCPECNGGAIAVVTKIDLPNGGDEIVGCTTCDDKTRVTLWKKWTYRD